MYGLLIALFWLISFVCIILLSNWRQELFQIFFTMMFFLIHGSLDTALTSNSSTRTWMSKLFRENKYPLTLMKITTGSKRLGARSIFYNLQISWRTRIEKLFWRERKETQFLTVASLFFSLTVASFFSLKIARSLFSKWTIKKFRKSVPWGCCPNLFICDRLDKFMNFRPTSAQNFKQSPCESFLGKQASAYFQAKSDATVKIGEINSIAFNNVIIQT